MKYTERVGELLPNILGKIFRELGFEVWVNPQQVNGVDLKVCRESNPVIVAEVLNWSIRSRLTLRRRDCIIENLNRFVCKKLLVHTIQLSGLDTLRENGIDLLCVGYQVLPQDFYDFYLNKEQIIRRFWII